VGALTTIALIMQACVLVVACFALGCVAAAGIYHLLYDKNEPDKCDEPNREQLVMQPDEKALTDVIGKALFGWAYDRIPDAQGAVQAVLNALRKDGYVITKPPPWSDDKR
jgi:hypothetical protein